jgi:hypothetical protein
MQLLNLFVLALSLRECDSQLIFNQLPDLSCSGFLWYQKRDYVELFQVVVCNRGLFYLLFRCEQKLDFLWKVITEEHKFDKSARVWYLMFYHGARWAQILWGAVGARLPARWEHDVDAHVSED